MNISDGAIAALVMLALLWIMIVSAIRAGAGE